MSTSYLNHLREEHARLEAEIETEQRRPVPDQLLVARLKKLKLAAKDKLTAAERSRNQSSAA